jgi:hypothetical protein
VCSIPAPPAPALVDLGALQYVFSFLKYIYIQSCTKFAEMLFQLLQRLQRLIKQQVTSFFPSSILSSRLSRRLTASVYVFVYSIPAPPAPPVVDLGARSASLVLSCVVTTFPGDIILPLLSTDSLHFICFFLGFSSGLSH